MRSYIIFQVNDTSYGIPIEQIKQLDVIEKITPIPNAPVYVEGIVFTRGEVIPVINLRKKYGLEHKPFDITTRLIHIQTDNRSFGLIVDAARDFMTLNETQILPPPKQGESPFAKELLGVVKVGEKLILILDALALADDETLQKLENHKL